MSHGFPRILTDQSLNAAINLSVMATAPGSLKHYELTQKIIGVFYDVYNELGHGFLESTYAEAITLALRSAGLRPAREVSIPVWFRGQKIGQYFADLIVEDVVLLELKATRAIDSTHEAQLLHYLRATEMEVGLLLNFGVRPQFRRLIFDNKRKKNPCKSVRICG